MKEIILTLVVVAIIGIGIVGVPIAASIAASLFGTILGVGLALVTCWAVVRELLKKDPS